MLSLALRIAEQARPVERPEVAPRVGDLRPPVKEAIRFQRELLGNRSHRVARRTVGLAAGSFKGREPVKRKRRPEVPNSDPFPRPLPKSSPWSIGWQLLAG